MSNTNSKSKNVIDYGIEALFQEISNRLKRAEIELEKAIIRFRNSGICYIDLEAYTSIEDAYQIIKALKGEIDESIGGQKGNEV